MSHFLLIQSDERLPSVAVPVNLQARIPNRLHESADEIRIPHVSNHYSEWRIIGTELASCRCEKRRIDDRRQQKKSAIELPLVSITERVRDRKTDSRSSHEPLH